MTPVYVDSTHAGSRCLFSWPDDSCTWKRLYPLRRPAQAGRSLWVATVTTCLRHVVRILAAHGHSFALWALQQEQDNDRKV